MMQILLMKARGLVLAWIVAALIAVPIGMGVAPVKAEASSLTDPGAADFSQGSADVANDGGFTFRDPIDTTTDPLTGREWWDTYTPSRVLNQLDDGTDAPPAAAYPAPATSYSAPPTPNTEASYSAPPTPNTEAKLPDTGGDTDAWMFAAIAGSLVVIVGLTTAGRLIIYKAFS